MNRRFIWPSLKSYKAIKRVITRSLKCQSSPFSNPWERRGERLRASKFHISLGDQALEPPLVCSRFTQVWTNPPPPPPRQSCSAVPVRKCMSIKKSKEYMKGWAHPTGEGGGDGWYFRLYWQCAIFLSEISCLKWTAPSQEAPQCMPIKSLFLAIG